MFEELEVVEFERPKTLPREETESARFAKKAVRHVKDGSKMREVSAPNVLETPKEVNVEQGCPNYDGYFRGRPGMKIGDGRFTMMHELGKGSFGSVWLCRTHKANCGMHLVAIKISRSSKEFVLNAREEAIALRHCNLNAPHERTIVKHYGVFYTFEGTRRFFCIIFPLMAGTCLSMLQRFQRRSIPLPVIQGIMFHFLQGIDSLHSKCGLIHGDLKPDNILLQIPADDYDWLTKWRAGNALGSDAVAENKYWEMLRRNALRCAMQEAHAVIGDLGSCLTIEEKYRPRTIMTRPYRAPEVILEISYDEMIDEFAAGCIMFEHLTGQLLFEPHSTERYSRDEDHLGQMMERLGEMPKWMVNWASKEKDLFNESGSLKAIPILITRPLYITLTETYMMDVQAGMDAASLIEALCHLDPTKRITAKESLKHSFFRTKYY